MAKELLKCEPRCAFCHRLRTFSLINREKDRPCRTERTAEIKKIKCEIGHCKICRRKVTLETCHAFDFDHRQESTKIRGYLQANQCGKW